MAALPSFHGVHSGMRKPSCPGDNLASGPIHPFARTAHSAGLRPGITVVPRGNGINPLCVSCAPDLVARWHNITHMHANPHI